VAIGDKCRHIYYTDEAGVLYHLDAKTDVRTECSATPDMSTLLFNDDFSQLLFRDEGGTVLMANGSRRTLNGIDVGDALHFLPNHRITARELPRAAQCMVGTFYKNYFLREREGHTELVFLDKEGSVKTVSSVDGASKVTVTDKGVFFLLTETESGEDHTKLYYAKYGKTELSVIAWDIQSFCPNVDGSRVLYTNQHGALFSYRHGGVPVRLCDSIKVDSLVVSADDVFYFYTTDGALCLSDNGEEMRTVFEEPAELLVDSHTVYFITEKQSDGTATVFVNYRNRRLNTLLSSGIARVE